MNVESQLHNLNSQLVDLESALSNTLWSLLNNLYWVPVKAWICCSSNLKPKLSDRHSKFTPFDRMGAGTTSALAAPSSILQI